MSLFEVEKKCPHCQVIAPLGIYQLNVERKIVRVSEVEEINPIIIKYLNRLSDLFYLMALYENKNQDQKEEPVNFDI